MVSLSPPLRLPNDDDDNDNDDSDGNDGSSGGSSSGQGLRQGYDLITYFVNVIHIPLIIMFNHCA